MTTAREHFTATLLSNGKVLVVRGYNPNFLSSVELYDPANKTWTVTAPMSNSRYDHTAILLPNGKVLVAGGFNDADNYLSNAELYDPARF